MGGMELNTRAVHAGREDLTGLGLHAVPIDLSTTYPSRDAHAEADRLDQAAAGVELGASPIYGRIGNPTVARFERALADLEGAESAVAFASGMAALSACLLAVAAQGKRHVVAVRPLYGTSDHLLASGLLGNDVTWSTMDTIRADIRPDTGLVVVETPANPTLSEVDIRAIDVAVPVLVDNTFATPVLQRPIELGADIVLHSATKYLGGHGDVLGGVVACGEDFARRLRVIRMVTGGILHPLAGYLLLRGLSTLPVRVTHASRTAAELARRLADHPGVSRVYRPSIGGPMVSFDVIGDPHAVIGAVRLVTPAVSLGSVDTLIQHPGSLSHHVMPEEDRLDAGIGDRLLRLSVGLEDVEDLWTDLDQALLKS
jgi:methionine-gamma-lyase